MLQSQTKGLNLTLIVPFYTEKYVYSVIVLMGITLPEQ
jgi:hypothetical protein